MIVDRNVAMAIRTSAALRVEAKGTAAANSDAARAAPHIRMGRAAAMPRRTRLSPSIAPKISPDTLEAMKSGPRLKPTAMGGMGKVRINTVGTHAL